MSRPDLANLRERLVVDQTGSRPVYLLATKNKNHIRLSPGAYYLLQQRSMGVSFTTLAEQLSRQSGQAISPEQAQAACRQVVKQVTVLDQTSGFRSRFMGRGKRLKYGGLALLAVLIIAYVLGLVAMPSMEGEAGADNHNVLVIGQDTLVRTVSATGYVESELELALRFEQGGIVAEVLVQPGQVVTAGTVLAHLETDQLKLAVKRAEAKLSQAEARLNQLHQPVLAERIASAQANLDSAQSRLAETEAGPTEDEITRAAAEVRQAEVILKQAQWAYDQIAYRGDIALTKEAAELERATLEYEAALANYNLTIAQATPAELAALRAELVRAQADLADLLQEPDAAEVAQARSAVEIAHLNLEEARYNLEKTTLTAPFDGVVAKVQLKPGEQAIPEAAIFLTDRAAYHLVVTVDEIDIGQIAIGQEATITLEAAPDQTFTGQVIDIALLPTQEGVKSVIAYEVKIAFEPGDLELLRSGLSATALIETQRLEHTLVIPNRAVQIDYQNNLTYVETLDENNRTVRVEVELGLRGETTSQVRSGLEAGDRVVIPTKTGLQQLTQAQQE